MDITDIRATNVKDILSVLRFQEGLTKKEIASCTQLSFSTVSNLCNALKEKGILTEEKLECATVGRNPNRFRLQFQRFCTLCLDLQMQGVMRSAVLDLRNTVLYCTTSDISDCTTADEIVARAVEQFQQVRAWPWLQQSLFVGVGVAVSGVFDRATRCIVNSSLPIFEGVPLTDRMEEGFQLPCYVDNEANLCALSMGLRGAGVGDLIYLHISEGTGLGVRSHGVLLRGRYGYGAEISHAPFGDPGLRCASCGAYGCLEADLGMGNLVRELGGAAPGESLGTAWKRLTRQVVDDPAAFSPFLKDKGEKLGAVMRLLVGLFDPEEIHLGGSIVRIAPLLLPYIQARLDREGRLAPGREMTVRVDPDSDLSILLGINEIIYEKWRPLDDLEIEERL